MLAIGLKIASWLSSTGLQSMMANLTNAYKARLQAGTDQEKLAADLAAKELSIQAQDAQLQAHLSEVDGGGPRRLIGYSVALYVAKLLVWDKVLGLGATDDVSQRLFWIIETVIIAYFGRGAVRDVVNAWRNKS